MTRITIRLRWLVAVALCLAVSPCFACFSCQDAPDAIFFGGPILTVDPADRVVEAIAVTDGTITAVGEVKEILALRASRTKVYDLAGKTLIPGLVAAHEHPAVTAVFGGLVDIRGFVRRSNAEVWDTLRQAVAESARGEWIIAKGLDPMLVPDLVMPTRASLDQLAPDNPVVIIAQTMHSFWANSKAFAEAGITRDTPDPGRGSYYERDENGDLTGFISEAAAAAPFVARLRSPLRMIRGYETALEELTAAGYTAVGSLGINVPPWLARWSSLHHLKPRIRQFIYLAKDELHYLPSKPDRDDSFFRIQGIKLWHDGSPYTGSMFIEAPYVESPLSRRLGIPPSSRGEEIIHHEELVNEIRTYGDAGWQVAIHSQGDASNRAAARALAEVADHSDQAPRRLEHCVLIPPDALDALAAARVSPSFHINHLWYYGDALADSILGEDRTATILPVRSAFDLGLRPSLHADSPMFPPEPFSLMRTAMLRRTSGGRVIGADQALSAQQALRAMTANGAYQLGADDLIGSIEVGKQADLVVLSGNPYETPADSFTDLRVLEVWVAGRRVDD